ncbi:hypothetical protein GGTG_08665 [Gaeumannomyces tritici R3-111a-1]|uniref:Secreted protein n=1 Tax=Gaeumannomyces tritici (strain R3-111a-1) TaxID=644352 RepID=J3P576_GAET3|nr:hypothetical protein GGTG_08665 [Gaeumannomyces tritici R3-111a-1]EJT74827.1 hypothetical protein GGTG_08665 [Gaeumannomyces tritici R3-111a-1]
MKTAVFALIATTLAGTSQALVVQRADEATPLPIGPLKWRGPEGSDLEDINTKIGADHPGLSLFDGSMNFTSASSTLGAVPNEGDKFVNIDAELEARASLEARNDRYSTNCNQHRYGGVAVWDIDSGIRHLRSVSRCLVNARQCVRTTCNSYSAIVFCNDNHYDIDMACSHIANMASDGVRDCHWEIYNPLIGGVQRFNHDKAYNVILGNCGNFSPVGSLSKVYSASSWSSMARGKDL